MSSGPVTLDFSKAIPIGTPDPSPADQQASTLKQSISYGASQNPDQYAKRLTLQKQTGVPPVVSEGNEPQIQQSADVNSIDYEKLVADHPRTTAWASKPDNAAVSGVSEVQRLAQIEKNTQAMRESNFVMTPLGGVTLDPLKPVKDWLGSTGDLIKNYIQAESQSMDPNDPENRLQGITVPGVRGPNGVTRSYTTSPESTTRAYQNFIAPAGQASTDFLVSQMQPENIAMLGAFSAIPTNTTAGRALHGAIGSYFAGKMGSDGLVQAYQSYREAEQGNTPGAVRDLVGSILNLGMAAEGTHGAAKVGSGSFHENLAETVASTEQSALKKRSPEAFHDAMQTITEGDPSLRVPIDQFMEYFHSKGVAAQSVAEQLGVKNFAEALVSGGDVEVPMADFLSKLDAEHQKSLLQDVVDPSSGMTPRQHEQQQKELDAWMTSGGPESLRAAAAQADAETASTPEYIVAKEELRNRYIGAGETPDVAETLATKDANVYANLAKQVGMKPAELMSLYDPQVKAAEAPGLEGQLNQADIPHIAFDETGNVVDADGRHRVIAALERGDRSIAIQTTMRDGGIQTLHVDPQVVAEKMGVTPESLRATDEQQSQFFRTLYQSAKDGDSPEEFTATHGTPLNVGDRMTLKRRNASGKEYKQPFEVVSLGEKTATGGQWYNFRAVQSEASDPRGWFRVLPDGSFEIGKTKIGDLSTFVHEPAHGYLQMIGDLAKRPEASDVLKGDYSKILDYLGAKDGETLTVDQQEKWARANEQYLREGKAPSEGLKGVFQRFSVWLSSIYKKASDLGVELTDDIRGVFDRLYAAEEGVTRAESESGPRLFQSAEEAGWTDEQFKQYAEAKGLEVDQAKSEILAKLNEAALREKTDTWREEESNVREAMTAEIDRKPEYIAIRSLRKGQLPDGTELKLSREELVKQFGEERVKNLQKQHPGLYRNEGGVDPEIAAEMLGYDSAGRMMKELESAPRRSAAISEATKAYMTAKHGDIRYDGTLNDQARLAVENQKKAQNLHSELLALRRKVAELKAKESGRKEDLRDIQIAPLEHYRDAAQQMVESKPIADLLPNRYLDASRKYSRESFDALRKGDVDAAIQAKHKELMNHFLFREATTARETADKITTYAKKLGQMKELRKLGLAGQPYLEQIQALLSRYNFDIGANRSLLEANGPRQESLAQFLTRLKTDENLDLPIDPALLDESRPKQNYRSIPFSELSNVYDAMRAIDHAAKVVNSVRANDRRIAIANAANDLNLKLEDSIGKPDVRKSSDRARSFLEKVQDVSLDISVLAPEFMFERFDGLTKQGPWHDYFWNRYNDASDHLNRLREQVFPKIMEYRGTKVDRSKKFYIESIDRTLTKDDIISVALNSGNESNLDKQMRGGIQFEKDQAATPLNEASLHEILSHLTADEIKMVNGIWKTIETLKPEAAALERKRSGIEPKWIEPKPLEIANGTLEGGYYPLKYDPRFSAAGEKQSDASTVQQMFAKYASNSTKQGYLKGRTEFAAPLTLDWQATVSRHLDEVATDISHWEFASDAQRLLKNPDVKSSIMRNLGNAYYKNLLDWVRYTVNQDSMGREASDNIDKFRRTMRNNVSTAVLGFRVMNAVVETGITPLLAIQHVPVESVFKGTMTYMRNPIEAARFATEASDYVKRLDKEVDRDITIALNDLAGKKSLFDDVRRWSIESRMWFWKIGAMMAWHAGYHDAVHNKGLEGQDAVRVADSIYRMTQEAGRPGDLSAVQRNPYMKELTQFIGPSLIQYNNYRRSFSAFKDQGFNQKTVGIGMTTLLAGAFVNNVLFNVLRGKGPEDKDKLPAWLAARMTFGMADGIPIARDAAGYAEGKILGEHGKDFRLSPALQVGKDTVDAGLSTVHAFEGKTTFGKAMKQDARAAGGLTGLPVTQGNITAEYIYDILSGNYKPAHPWSPITDAFYARPKK